MSENIFSLVKQKIKQGSCFNDLLEVLFNGDSDMYGLYLKYRPNQCSKVKPMYLQPTPPCAVWLHSCSLCAPSTWFIVEVTANVR